MRLKTTSQVVKKNQIKSLASEEEKHPQGNGKSFGVGTEPSRFALSEEVSGQSMDEETLAMI